MPLKIIFYLIIFLLPSISMHAQTKQSRKKSNSKKEKIVEIEEDMIISTLKVDTVGILQPGDVEFSLPKTFDTSAIPVDELTKSIEKLIIELDVINSVIKMTGDIIKKKQMENTEPAANAFFNRFYSELNSDEVKNYYHDLYVRLYRKYYNNDEVLQLTEFYKTSLGKKTYISGLLIGSDALVDGTKFGEYLAKKILNEISQ